ncbi:SPOSA6832_02250, partial [Sporobolomyces salmonicolor]
MLSRLGTPSLLASRSLAHSALPLPLSQLAIASRSSASSRSLSTSPLLRLASAAPSPARPRTPFPTSLPPRRRPSESTGRDLPELKSRTPLYLALFALAALAWAAFLAYATNAERANSSVVRSLAFQLRSWPAVREFLGDGVRIDPVVADFVRIKGNINMLAGRIDVQFRPAALPRSRLSAAASKDALRFSAGRSRATTGPCWIWQGSTSARWPWKHEQKSLLFLDQTDRGRG